MNTSIENKKIAGVILAGGKSSRMGRDKALLSYKGARLIDYIASILNAMQLPVYVSGNTPSFSCIPDSVPNCGPLGGIMSSVNFLLTQKIQAAIFVPVDMPCINKILLSSLMDAHHNEEVVFYQDNPLPLFLCFSPKVIGILNDFKKHNDQDVSVHGFINKLNFYRRIPSEMEKTFLVNTNTPEDWQSIKEHNDNDEY